MIPHRSRLLAATLVITVVAACSGSDTDTGPQGPPTESSTQAGPSSAPIDAVTVGAVIDDLEGSIGRVDIRPTGNRVVEGAGSFGSVVPQSVQLDEGRTARWIVPGGDAGWSVVLDDGSSVRVSEADGELVVSPGSPPGTFATDVEPPIVGADGEPLAPSVGRRLFTDPLPDARVVTDGERLVALGGPTDRYDHGVLGDSFEGSTISSIGPDGAASTLVELDAPDVFEAVSPMLADIDDDGDLDVIVTVSNASSGARISGFDLDGNLIAETPAIGLGNRWRNLLAVAPIGPDGQTELIDVQTPHIGGILQFFRTDATGTMVLVASTQTYSTHSIGSRNLDQGVVTDADGDGRLDVLLPSQDQRALAVVTRDDAAESGVRETTRIALGARLTTNLAALTVDGLVGYAVGTDDGRVTVWPRSG